MTTSNVREPSALHRAALTLHGLCPSDREWLLQSLSPGQQHALLPLLGELQALGIPRDARLFEEALQVRSRGTRSAPSPFNEADAAQLVEWLAAEPPRVAAALLQAGDVSWLERRLAADSSCDTRQAADARPAAPALQAAVREEIARRLCAVRPRAEPESLQARLRRVLQLGGARS